MPTRHVIISAHNGVHARPVAELVRLAQAHEGPIVLRTTSGTEVDLSSVLAVMDLALSRGDEVVLSTAESPTADAVLESLVGVLARQD
ncbi:MULTISPECIES: HPr family phosphocarrier protein [unclassified Microbacterium]|uniref:HPr family phosphocarrier protein n=1 Tax=unclassified Microbacterium TaxID=2609290 RepID=UPI00216A9971|nr:MULTISPECIES: HPr family phosphocarrier protein [unclassified Microbacterium]MCS3844750.1 phosphotransferase system HPr (HPr) family protein [Microbacterium sp. AK031]MDP3950959.1 HPr family phosphocarrier protein [Microbacterium sp.]